MEDYLQDLADIGIGRGPRAVARHLIENGIAAALEAKLIAPREASDYKKKVGDDDASVNDTDSADEDA